MIAAAILFVGGIVSSGDGKGRVQSVPLADACSANIRILSGNARPDESGHELFLEFTQTLETLLPDDTDLILYALPNRIVRRNVLSARLFPLARAVKLTGTADCFEESRDGDQDLEFILRLDTNEKNKKLAMYILDSNARDALEGVGVELVKQARRALLNREGRHYIGAPGNLHAWGNDPSSDEEMMWPRVKLRDSSGETSLTIENARRIWNCLRKKAPLNIEVTGPLVIDATNAAPFKGSLEIHPPTEIVISGETTCLGV